MNTSSIWGPKGLESQNPTPLDGAAGSQLDKPRTRLADLKLLASRLMNEVDSLNEVRTLDLQKGIDFYEEVKDFEVGLIKRALALTHGHQGRAARLLNLKVTTLNSKIKMHKITPTAFANGYSMIDGAEMDIRQFA